MSSGVSQHFKMCCLLSIILFMGVGGTSAPSTVIIPEASEDISTSSRTDTENQTETTPNSVTCPNQCSVTCPNHIPCSTTASPEPECFFCIKGIMDKNLLIVALLAACAVLLISTLLLACKVCSLKKQVFRSYLDSKDSAMVTTQSAAQRASVDGEQTETVFLMNETSKPEKDENQGELDQPEDLETMKEAAPVAAEEATEVCYQATMEDSAQVENQAAESPPKEECESGVMP